MENQGYKDIIHLKDLLVKMIAYDQQERLDIEDFLNSKWIKEN
jgi:hypothetical protein